MTTAGAHDKPIGVELRRWRWREIQLEDPICGNDSSLVGLLTVEVDPGLRVLSQFVTAEMFGGVSPPITSIIERNDARLPLHRTSNAHQNTKADG